MIYIYKVFNKTYQPFNLFCGRIPARDYITVEEMDEQLLNLEKRDLIKITKIPNSVWRHYACYIGLCF